MDGEVLLSSNAFCHSKLRMMACELLLSAIASTRAGSFLAVLKRFGAQDSNFSFPMEGYSLALDFPVNKGSLDLMKRLDNITLEYGGRFYLPKTVACHATFFSNPSLEQKIIYHTEITGLFLPCSARLNQKGWGYEKRHCFDFGRT